MIVGGRIIDERLGDFLVVSQSSSSMLYFSQETNPSVVALEGSHKKFEELSAFIVSNLDQRGSSHRGPSVFHAARGSTSKVLLLDYCSVLPFDILQRSYR